MAAHKLLAANGSVKLKRACNQWSHSVGFFRFDVVSYGTARQVKLPAPNGALESAFGTAYSDLLQRIESRGPEVVQWFQSRKLLGMLQRNVGIKDAPERWQAMSASDLHKIDVVITFEERVFDALNEDVMCREQGTGSKPLHVVNLDTKDDPDAANIGAKYALALVEHICNSISGLSAVDSEGMEHQIEEVMAGSIAVLRHDTMAGSGLVPLHMMHLM
jgi:RNA polymerase II subunit A C-terminal domain phosphatase SSU72